MQQSRLYRMHVMLFSACITQTVSAIFNQLFSILTHTEQHSSESNMPIWSLKLQAFSEHRTWSNTADTWKDYFFLTKF